MTAPLRVSILTQADRIIHRFIYLWGKGHFHFVELLSVFQKRLRLLMMIFSYNIKRIIVVHREKAKKSQSLSLLSDQETKRTI